MPTVWQTAKTIWLRHQGRCESLHRTHDAAQSAGSPSSRKITASRASLATFPRPRASASKRPTPSQHTSRRKPKTENVPQPHGSRITHHASRITGQQESRFPNHDHCTTLGLHTIHASRITTVARVTRHDYCTCHDFAPVPFFVPRPQSCLMAARSPRERISPVFGSGAEQPGQGSPCCEYRAYTAGR